jgi:hypothetical protein
MYNKRKFGQPHQGEQKRLSIELLVTKKKAQETFLLSVLQNEIRCWTEFYKYVKRRKGNRENILVIRDHKGKLITDPIEKAKSLNPCCTSLFRFYSNNLQMQSIQSGKPFIIIIDIIRKRLSAIGRKKSVGPYGIPRKILMLDGEAMIPYLARLLDITMKNNALQDDWKKAIVVPIYTGDRSVFGSLTSVVCKQMEHVVVGN